MKPLMRGNHILPKQEDDSSRPDSDQDPDMSINQDEDFDDIPEAEDYGLPVTVTEEELRKKGLLP